MDVERLMRVAVDVCRKGIAAGQSPFACVVASPDGRVIATAHNTVRLDQDPTAHAEINAIRAACLELSRIDLSNHVLFTTCEPCPMCAAAIHWARIEKVYYGALIEDAASAGFNELRCPASDLYRCSGSRVVVEGPLLRGECAGLFNEWLDGPNPVPY